MYKFISRCSTHFKDKYKMNQVLHSGFEIVKENELFGENIFTYV